MATHTSMRPRDDPTSGSSEVATRTPRSRLSADFVLPVHDEAAILERSVRRLCAFLEDADSSPDLTTGVLPFDVRIVIVDNGSTDGTLEIARRLTAAFERVSVLRLPEKGRGRALRAAWTVSRADLVGYMDVDLSTDLNALLPLLAPLASGHSDLTIGSRLARGARTVRGATREITSRGYNKLLHLTCRAGFTDAQCGFKALRRDVAVQLLPRVENDNWFFDTELLLLAERSGLRITEIPVDWTDDPDSRVDIPRTILEDLRGIAGVHRRIARGTFHANAHDPRRHGPLRQLGRFLAVGSLCTAGYLALFSWLDDVIPAQAANALALAVMTVLNTVLHRRITFSVRGRERILRDHAESAIVCLLFFAVTTAALAVLDLLLPAPDQTLRLAALAGASVLASPARFAAMRWWVFDPLRRSPRPSHREKEPE